MARVGIHQQTLMFISAQFEVIMSASFYVRRLALLAFMVLVRRRRLPSFRLIFIE